MILTLVLITIGALLFLVIVYNMLQQYRQKQAAEKRGIMIRHSHIVNETEELLLNAGQLPYSRTLVLILYQRVQNSLQTMVETDPNNAQLASRLENVRQQITDAKDNFPPVQGNFKRPESDQQALHMLKLVKRLRHVVRQEHNKGKVGSQAFVAEDRRLELIQLKINLSNMLKRVRMAITNRETAAARQMLEKGKKILSNLADKDDQLLNIEETIQEWINDLDTKQQQVEQQKEEQEKEKSELDMLFEPKRKW
ncbi:DNA repair ATPase [Oceanimonas sp. CHS3-5]|uniref:DNA repair ATPase n=1 Tax=Oceanimonas sp. CHS3-5 TaxID=3068186 RepID=UPI00273D8E13|nr:DNA repair ATPase [Oceanimonas sp. CHS3-5]MDP5291276.1 DNA repair ATPase [Oceanimonas sp. CHS3-5]